MKVQIFTLCDGAYNYDGRLTIVGSYDNLKVPSFPCRVDTCCAIKLETNQDDHGDACVRVLIKSTDGTMLSEGFNSNIPIPNVAIAHLGMAINFRGIAFTTAGEYKLCLEVGESFVQELYFSVMA